MAGAGRQAPGLAEKGIMNTGTVRPRNGPVVTAGGLMFGRTRRTDASRVRLEGGRVLWEHELEANPEGIPAVYEVGGRQYIAFAAGASWGTGSDPVWRNAFHRKPGALEAQGYPVFALPGGRGGHVEDAGAIARIAVVALVTVCLCSERCSGQRFANPTFAKNLCWITRFTVKVNAARPGAGSPCECLGASGRREGIYARGEEQKTCAGLSLPSGSGSRRHPRLGMRLHRLETSARGTEPCEDKPALERVPDALERVTWRTPTL